jgi:hypothetical protein
MNNINVYKRSLYREGDIDDYYIIEDDFILGEGGFSVVRRGIKRDTGETFAVKIIDKYAFL